MTGAALSHAFANDYGDYGFNLILPLLCRAWHCLLGVASEKPQALMDIEIYAKKAPG